MGKSKYTLKYFPWSSHTLIAQILDESGSDSILDVGSHDGFLGRSLTYKPRDLCAIDKVNFSLPEAYSSFWVADLDITDFSFLKNKNFQTIVFADVLEHVQNPDLVVSKLNKHIEKGGSLIFSFPNMGFFIVRILAFFSIRPKMKRGLYDATHLHDFNLTTSKIFLKNFRLREVKFIATPVPLPTASILFKEGFPLFFIYRIMNFMAQKFPDSFAYQFIFEAKINEI